MERRIDRHSQERVYNDVLTGLPSRLLFTQLVGLELAKMPPTGEILAVGFIDLNRFKKINDRLGYRCGDRLLQSIADRLQKTFGTEATIGRWCGDEFAVAIPKLADIAAVKVVAERILNCFALPFVFDRDLPTLETNSLYVNASIGIGLATDSDREIEPLFQRVDAALERAQANGGNSYEIYTDPLVDPTNDRWRLERILDRVNASLAGSELEHLRLLSLHYQPQIDIDTGKIIGVESLLRCQDARDRFISPSDLIPIAEETGSIVKMGEWVIRTACEQNKKWQDLGFGKFPIAVNFSVKQLQTENLIETINAILTETQLAPDSLEIEITESIAIKNLDKTIATLHALRAIGVKISLDDFGTGYSSLAALKYLPLDRLKIDRSFVRELRANTVDAGIVRTIVNLGHELNLHVIAEGVETTEQLDFLRSVNCDAAQGFLFSRPLCALDFERLLVGGSIA